eukprot:CAMPEP_0183736728 /NCGR_PEP_ID=MMETSP0737-20130205/50100_1 /TAXON_ID=385413 /ORGANISM="Thalassiosira miniscula, Strain CCMP1093" /LENGTH=67 /DNA_ID=CAMNT_0025970813 /DNA_START=160 /DNA_END=363 /DNA_ORIENTATION=+
MAKLVPDVGKYLSAVAEKSFMYESAGMKFRAESSTGRLMSPYKPKPNSPAKNTKMIAFPGFERIFGA